MSRIAEQLAKVKASIAAAIERRKVPGGGVELIAVSKTFPVEAIREAAESGARVFGESKLQEAESKIDQLPDDLEWHFIGRVQRNKVRRLIHRFTAIHGIDSLRLATHVNAVAADEGLRPRVFLQVNLSGESSKGGFAPSQLAEQMHLVGRLQHLEMIGLMTIPPLADDPETSRPWFRQLRSLRDEWAKNTGIPLPGLSMGMSADYEVAVEEGATHVRVGSSIFGARTNRVVGELGERSG